MKVFLFFSLMLLIITQFTTAQDLVQSRKPNAMSNVVSVTVDGGISLAYTDYTSTKLNYMWKGSVGYFFPSSSTGNFGARAFGETGFISGKGAPAFSGNPTNEFTTNVNMIGGELMYTISIDDNVYPFLALGLSNLWVYPKDGSKRNLPNYQAGNYSSHMLAYNGDLGVRFIVSRSISIDLTGSVIIGTKDFMDDLITGSNNDMFYTLTAGVSYYFGRDRDSDGDGVPDSRDKCPGTPKGIQVDDFGCPLDTDNDGVPDYLDKCANTPVGVKVDASGCPLDSDGDGVPDYLDKCANTPAGVAVNSNGCPLDSDGDGVPDYLDKCPNTPAGVQVDADGCPIKKEQVKVIVQPAEVESLVLSGDTNFEFNKSKLLPNAFPVLDGLVGTMKKHLNYKWEIGGYTDGIGSVSYNKKLSKQRAASVVEYLVSKGINEKSLVVVGYGKENPIATNDTNEGRAMNRRVEIKVISKDFK